jgi:hypothetical protein
MRSTCCAFIPRIDTVFVLAIRSQREDEYKHGHDTAGQV